MWANAQHDGRPAEYRVESSVQSPVLDCCAVMLPNAKPVEICWVPQTRQQISAVSGPWNSPYYDDMWRRYCCLTSIFLIIDTCLSCEDTARQICAMVPRWRFLHLVFSVSCVEYISDLHSKFTLRPHHVWKYGRHPYATAEIRGGKNQEEERNRTKI